MKRLWRRFRSIWTYGDPNVIGHVWCYRNNNYEMQFCLEIYPDELCQHKRTVCGDPTCYYAWNWLFPGTQWDITKAGAELKRRVNKEKPE